MKASHILTENKSTIGGIALKYGLLTAAGLTGFFLFMYAIGLAHIVELRVLNFLILVTGVWSALKAYKKAHPHGSIYLQSLTIGVSTTAVGVVPFAVFIFFYFQINTEFMEYIKANEMFGQYLNPYMAAFLIAFEGCISGLLLSFIMMQYLKNRENN